MRLPGAVACRLEPLQACAEFWWLSKSSKRSFQSVSRETACWIGTSEDSGSENEWEGGKGNSGGSGRGLLLSR